MNITKKMILDWNGDASLEDLALYLCAILNKNVSLDQARKEILDYYEIEDETCVAVSAEEYPRNSSSLTTSA